MKYIFDGERIGRWVCEKTGGTWHLGNTGIAIEKDGKLVVGIMYEGFTGASILMHSRCDDPKATTREFYRMIFDYPFNQLGVKRITGIVPETNLRAQQVDEKLGFIYETRLEDYFNDGAALIYIMRKSDCKWIKSI